MLWVAALLVIVLAVWRAANEERLFLRSVELGPGYSEYVGRTGRFVPKRRTNPPAQQRIP